MATALPLTNRLLTDTSKNVSFNSMSAKFGDGYEQVAPKGLNNKIDNWDIAWVGLTLTEVTTITDVLDSVGTWGILTWTPFNETVAKKFRLTGDGYTVEKPGRGTLRKITCRLHQVFDIG